MRGFVARRRDHREPEPHQSCRFDERGGDVVAVADVDHPLFAERAARLFEGHEVGKDLAWVRAIGEAVDDRFLGAGRELHQVCVAAHAGDDPVDVAIEDAGRIVDGFAPPELDVLLAQGGRRPAQPGDPDLERHPRAVRRLLEEHGDVTPRQRVLRPPAGLDGVGELQDRAQLGLIQIRDVQEVPSPETCHCRDHDAPTGRSCVFAVARASV